MNEKLRVMVLMVAKEAVVVMTKIVTVVIVCALTHKSCHRAELATS